jgi:hypothetical protein
MGMPLVPPASGAPFVHVAPQAEHSSFANAVAPIFPPRQHSSPVVHWIGPASKMPQKIVPGADWCSVGVAPQAASGALPASMGPPLPPPEAEPLLEPPPPLEAPPLEPLPPLPTGLPELLALPTGPPEPEPEVEPLLVVPESVPSFATWPPQDAARTMGAAKSDIARARGTLLRDATIATKLSGRPVE